MKILHILWIQTFYQICDLNIFSPSMYLLLTVFLEEKFFLLMKSNLSFFLFFIFFLLWIMPLVSYLRKFLSNLKGCKDLLHMLLNFLP